MRMRNMCIYNQMGGMILVQAHIFAWVFIGENVAM